MHWPGISVIAADSLKVGQYVYAAAIMLLADLVTLPFSKILHAFFGLISCLPGKC